MELDGTNVPCSILGNVLLCILQHILLRVLARRRKYVILPYKYRPLFSIESGNHIFCSVGSNKENI